jgi:putative endonuclease
MMNTAQKGKKGENEAEVFFRKAGYSVLDRNYRRPQGEIDLIIRKDNEIVFAEVKHWTSYTAESIEQGIPRRKMRRIMETSKFFLREHPEFDDFHIRYDILFLPGGGEKAYHIEDAFREEG